MWIAQWLMMSYGGGKKFPKTWLVSYYKLDNNANDSHWSNNGTISGATYTGSGKINGAYSFDGVNDVITAGTELNIPSSYTVSFCVNIDALPTTGNLQSFFFKRGNWFGYGWECQIYNNWWTQQWFVSHNNTFNPINVSLTTGSFIHLVVKYASNTITFYQNNSVVGTVSQSQTCTAYADLFRIGDWGGVGRHFKWLMDEIGIWSRALTTDEISDLYNWWLWLPYS